MMTTLYLDTEFNGIFRGQAGELISMALVSPEGQRWYAAKHLCDMSLSGSACAYDAWVAEHVLPVLGVERLGFREFSASFREFISKFDDPTIVCTSPMDAMHFCMLLNGGRDVPLLDISFRIEVVRFDETLDSEIPHNALADAIALMRWHQEMQVGGDVMFERHSPLSGAAKQIDDEWEAMEAWALKENPSLTCPLDTRIDAVYPQLKAAFEAEYLRKRLEIQQKCLQTVGHLIPDGYEGCKLCGAPKGAVNV